jgi:uncharacterized membrane protein (DUF485 family)
MDEVEIRKILDNRAFQTLIAKRRRLSRWLVGLLLVFYFGFVFAMAFAPQLLASSFLIPIGLLLGTVALTGIYVWRANGEFDGLTAKVLDDVS